MSMSPDARLSLAETFVDTFYTFDRQALAGLVGDAQGAENVLYYQAWAEAAHYRVERRTACEHDAEQVVCAVTVTDDFGAALGYQATDTFRMRFDAHGFAGIEFAGDDPPVFEALFAWIGEHRPEVFAGPCQGMFDGGTTPGDCARAVAQAARDFMAQRHPD